MKFTSPGHVAAFLRTRVISHLNCRELTFTATRAGRLLAVALVMFNFHSFADDGSAAVSPREHLSLDANWKFHLGDDWPDALHLDKAGASTGPASEKFGDASWRSLNLPHDWAIELPFDKICRRQPRLQAGRAGLPQKQHRLVSPHV